MAEIEHEEWKGNTGGTNWMHKSLIWIFAHVNLRLVYAFMAVFVIPFYMLFAHKGYISMYHFFRQRMKYGVLKSFAYVYRNHYRFGQVILDRFAVYAGKKFDFTIEGNDLFVNLCEQEPGFMVLSSHVGNYELAGYAFHATKKKFNALVFSGEAKVVMENRQRVLGGHNINMIPMSADMSHVILMNDALQSGEIVSIPGDRIFGSPRFLECEFFGEKAKFPLGPYAIASRKKTEVLAIFVMKESVYHYRVFVRKINTDMTGLKRDEKAAQLAQSFASEIEDVVRRYPEQWFNYYEFWNDDKS